jgi:uncharacterized protein (TIGR02594 family)
VQPNAAIQIRAFLDHRDACGTNTERSIEMDDAPWMKIAKAEIGQAEVKGEAENNPRILEYLATTGKFKADETPWCSAFANWAMVKAGKKGTNSALARSWLKWGEAIEEPRYGCLVVFKRGNSAWQGHVGFFVRMEGEKIVVLGGNQANTVSIAPRSKSDLLGYRWPGPKD